MSSNPQNKVSVWGVAIGGSLLIHFVLLGLLAMTAGGNSTPPEPPAELPAPAPAASASAAEGDNGGQGTARPTRVVTPAAPRQSSAATTPASSTSSSSQDEVVTYVVKQGDNLTKIARACGATVPELAELNGKPIKRLEKLWVGQKIKLPRPISE